MTRQKLPKMLAILGGCLLGGGIVLAGAGFVAMGCNLDAYTGGKEAPQPLTASYSPGAVTAVKVDASVGDVTVVGTEAGGDLEVLYSTSYACQEEGGVLTLTEQEGAGGWKWYRIWNSWEGREDGVTIQVPWDMLLSYDLTTGVGDLRMEDVDAERVAVAGDSGDIRLYSVTGTDFTVSQGVGNTHLENCQGEDLSLSADVGTAQMEDCRFTDAGMEASTGDLLLYTSDFDTLTIDGDVGEVRLSHVAVDGPLSCTTGVGDISVWLVESPDIRLAADTGKIDGTIRGDQNDYQITVDCQIGSSSLKDQLGHGEKKLQLATGVGDIGVTFVGEEDEGFD